MCDNHAVEPWFSKLLGGNSKSMKPLKRQFWLLILFTLHLAGLVMAERGANGALENSISRRMAEGYGRVSAVLPELKTAVPHFAAIDYQVQVVGANTLRPAQ
jgi:hypothetical protein